MIVTGIGVSGKSYAIDAMRNLLNDLCRVCSYFGIAAFNVKGTTLQLLLQLPMRGNKNAPLKSVALARLQNDLAGVDCLVIDKFSNIVQKMFVWINRSCKEATGNNTLPFAVILVGDSWTQLPPITDQVIYLNKPRDELEP